MSGTFFGHPRGLATLFFTEMWERFTYYGMRAVLVLFLVAAISTGGFGIDDKTATAIYGLYTAGVYLAALPGGWIADRLIGAQHAVLAGGLAITAGNFLLALSTSPRGFYIGLVVIVLGVGLLKPNVSAIVADLYPEGGARLDAGFTVFYIGINVGGFLGPLVTGWALMHYGARAGFAAAAIFMGVGVLQFVFTRRYLGSSGAAPTAARAAGRARQWGYLYTVAGLSALVLAAVSCGWITVNA
ncbi:MAG: oligopeptide:H+ symporter, partial [Gammaproteobacteria bacterium]